jgi:hypothetical protein
MDAIGDLQNNPHESHPWRDIQSQWFTQHLTESFLTHHGDKNMTMLF